MICAKCKYHQQLYYVEQGEYYPSNLFRCLSHNQKATYSKRVLSDRHPFTRKCKWHSDNEAHDGQMMIEVDV